MDKFGFDLCEDLSGFVAKAIDSGFGVEVQPEGQRPYMEVTLIGVDTAILAFIHEHYDASITLEDLHTIHKEK